jgi:DNA-3-methyladenine glycosylase I
MTDTVQRCSWCDSSDLYRHYHDVEWGYPMADERLLFEMLSLELFQSGLSWITILKRREGFRQGFAGFDVKKVAHFGEADVARLLQDEGIIRHRGKIEAAINNAGRAVELAAQEGSLGAYLWRFEPRPEDCAAPQSVTTSAASIALSKDLKRRGWKFVGPTTMFAFMQAMGLINDHIEGCVTRAAVERARAEFRRPGQ